MNAMKHCHGFIARTRQKGTALMVALIILIGITLLSIAGINTSILELRMARNLESTSNTFQVAMAALDYVVSDDANLPTTGPLDTPDPVTLPQDTPAYDGELFDCSDGDCGNGAGEEITTTATRLADCAPPPRARLATSLPAFSAFEYEARARVDKNATGNGRTEMVLGYILLGPKC